MTQEVVKVKDLSLEDLKRLTAVKEAEEKKKRAEEKEQYETNKDETIKAIIAEAGNISSSLLDFKKRLHVQFAQFKELLDEYGGIRSNSKGGFSLVSKDGNYKVVRRLATTPSWDERSTKAVELIGDFLRDTVKKKDLKLFEILYSFIEKNQKGDLEYSKVMHLLKHQDKYDDARWIEGLNLIQESYSVHVRAFAYEFFVRNLDTNEFERLEINFSSL